MLGKKKKDYSSLKNPKDKNALVRFLKKAWYFIWHDDSILSWLVNLVLAFVLIKFIIYPGIGLIFGTSYPIVAVVSSSMEHQESFDKWWLEQAYCGDYGCGARCLCTQGDWYNARNISKREFEDFRFTNGFNRGDIMVLFGIQPKDVRVGDVIVYNANRPVPTYPIIHRVVKIRSEEKIYFETKGDNNINSINDGYLNEHAISETQLIGRAVFRIPYLGYVKIWFTEIFVAPFTK
jgi:signal peptidase I